MRNTVFGGFFVVNTESHWLVALWSSEKIPKRLENYDAKTDKEKEERGVKKKREKDR